MSHFKMSSDVIQMQMKKFALSKKNQIDRTGKSIDRKAIKVDKRIAGFNNRLHPGNWAFHSHNQTPRRFDLEFQNFSFMFGKKYRILS